MNRRPSRKRISKQRNGPWDRDCVSQSEMEVMQIDWTIGWIQAAARRGKDNRRQMTARPGP